MTHSSSRIVSMKTFRTCQSNEFRKTNSALQLSSTTISKDEGTATIVCSQIDSHAASIGQLSEVRCEERGSTKITVWHHVMLLYFSVLHRTTLIKKAHSALPLKLNFATLRR